MPVSGSGVMLEAVTSNGGSSKRNPPDNALSNCGPFGPIGVWQLWQVITVSTRYLPRSTGVCAKAAPMITHTPASPRTATRIILAPPIAIQDPARSAVSRYRPLDDYRLRGQRLLKPRLSAAAQAVRLKRAARRRPRVDRLDLAHSRRRGGLLGLDLLRHRAAILALGLDVAVNDLDHRD